MRRLVVAGLLLAGLGIVAWALAPIPACVPDPASVPAPCNTATSLPHGEAAPLFLLAGGALLALAAARAFARSGSGV